MYVWALIIADRGRLDLVAVSYFWWAGGAERLPLTHHALLLCATGGGCGPQPELVLGWFKFAGHMHHVREALEYASLGLSGGCDKTVYKWYVLYTRRRSTATNKLI